MYPLSKNSETTCNISYKFPHVIFIKKSWKLFQHIQKSFRFFFRICKSLCSYRASFLTNNFIFRNRRTLLSPCLSKLMETHMCKNLFLCNRQETAFYLLLMPGDKKIQDKITLINAIPIFFHNCATLIVEIRSHPLATEYTSVIPIDFLSRLSNLFLLNHIILLRRLQPYLP